jgi:metallophosphoesterase (TIGR00282 family)
MRLLFVGDVVGRPGREIVRDRLRTLASELRADLVVVNAENAAGGVGITPATAKELFRAGADVLTGGNHSWDKREILPFIEECPTLLRPANFPEGTPGRGACIVTTTGGVRVGIVNIQGRVFLHNLDDPFAVVNRVLDGLAGQVEVILVDFHAEATSEKIAMGWHLDGRVAAVVGTHTHVPTADSRVLPGGTAYITDVGMTGPYDGVIGVRKEEVLERFMTQRPVRYSVAEGDVRLAGVVVDCDPSTGFARSIERVEVRAEIGP